MMEKVIAVLQQLVLVGPAVVSALVGVLSALIALFSSSQGAAGEGITRSG
jgi:hypothetical protein